MVENILRPSTGIQSEAIDTDEKETTRTQNKYNSADSTYACCNCFSIRKSKGMMIGMTQAMSPFYFIQSDSSSDVYAYHHHGFDDGLCVSYSL